MRAYQQRLALLAQQVDNPLYVLLTGDSAAPEAHFLEACRARVPVTIFDVREMVADAPDCALLVRALQCDTDGADLRSDAALLQQQPVAHDRRLRLFAAHGLEQEAQAADVQIRRWLLEGKRIHRAGGAGPAGGAARAGHAGTRAGAGAGRDRLDVRDAVGEHGIDALAGCAAERFLLPGCARPAQVAVPLCRWHGAASANRRSTCSNRLVRKHGVVAHLQGFFDTAEREAPELIQPLARLRQAIADRATETEDRWAGWCASRQDAGGVAARSA